MTNDEKRVAGMKKFNQPVSEMTKLEYFSIKIASILQVDEDFLTETNEYLCMRSVEIAEKLLEEIAFAEYVHEDEINEY